MKKLAFAIPCTIIFLIASFLVGQSAREYTPSEKNQLPTQIRLKSPNGKRSITITCRDYYAGIYIENAEKGRGIHLYDAGAQQAIGFYDNLDHSVFALAFYIDENGSPIMQTVKNGGPKNDTLKVIDLSTIK